MNFGFRTLAALCSVAVSLNTGCSSHEPYNTADGETQLPLFSMDTPQTEEPEIIPDAALAEDFSPASQADCEITFGGDSVAIGGEGASVSGNTVTISENGVYFVSGECADGRLSVTAEKVSLILDGLSLTSKSASALEYSGAGRLTLTLSGEESSLSGKGSAVHAQGGLTINGSGSLNASGENGIICGGALKICGGNIGISSENSGITGCSYMLLSGGNTSIRSDGDGIRLSPKNGASGYLSMDNGSLDIRSSRDGIRTEDGIFLSGGEVRLSCGGGSSAVMHVTSGERHSYGRHGGFFTDGSRPFDFSDLVAGDGSKAESKKGLRTGGAVKISGGIADIDSADDSIYAAGGVCITEGTVRLATGDDGIHSDGAVSVSGGKLTVSGSYSAIEGMSVDIGGGVLLLKAFHDGINAAGGNDIDFAGSSLESSDRYISISGGEVLIDSGGDGIDSGGTAAMSGGTVTIFGSQQEGFGSIYYSDSFALSGGTLAAFGSAGITKAPSLVSGICISVYAEAKRDGKVELRDSRGSVLFSTVIPRDFGSLIFSSDKLTEGEVYSVYADNELLAAVTASAGVCGGGPDSTDNGRYDNIMNGSQNGDSGMVA